MSSLNRMSLYSGICSFGIALMVFLGLSLHSEQAQACHAIALVNPQQNPVTGGIEVTASSDSPTCGCDEYWIDLEVRCMDDAYDAAPFAANYWGPETTYPYFQSDQMLKPSCVVKQYPWIYIPYSGLCPGITYKYRMRENHNGDLGPWTADQTFTVPGTADPLTAVINASTTTICSGDCVSLEAQVTGGCELALSYQWDNGAGTANPVSVCPTTTTTYSVTVTESCSQMTTVESVTIDVLPSPVAGTASLTSGGSGSDPSQLCEGQTATVALTGYAGTILWQSSTDGGGTWTDISGATNDTYTSDPLFVDHCFRAEVSGCGGSVFSNDICVTILPPPTVTVNNETICDGDTTTLTATPSPGGGTYLWSTSETTQSIDVFPSATTTYTVTYTSIEGCPSAPADGTVTVDPTAIVTLNDDEVCITAGDCAVLTADPSITGGTYLWDTGETTQTISPCPTTDTPYSITYTLNNCVSEPVTGTVYITTIHDATITPAGPFCPYDDEVTLTAASSGGTWMGTGITDATNGIFDPVVAGTGIHTISYVIPDPCGDSASTDIVVEPLPMPSFTNSDECRGSAVIFTNTSTISSGSITDYDWNFGDAGTSTLTDPTHAYAIDSTYNVQLIATSAQGCMDTTVQTVLIDDIPLADFSAPSVCFGGITSFADQSTVNGANISDWSWDFDDNNTSTLANPDNTYNTPGTYNVQLTVTADGPAGCSHDTIKQVVVHYPPVADFTYDPNVCDGYAMDLFDNSTSLSGNVVTWEWDINNDGTVEYTVENPSHLFPAEGTYDIALQVTTNFGCMHDTVLPVIVHPLPIPSFTNDDACELSIMAFTNTSTIISGSITGNDWDFGDATTSTQTNPAHIYGANGTYNVQLIATSDQGCVDSITQTVSVDDVPDADFIASTVCIGNTTQFNDLSTVNGASIVSWDWYFDDSNTSTLQNPDNTYASPGTYNVQLTVAADGPAACVNTVTLPVTVHADPVADFSPTEVCLNTPTQFFDQSTPSGTITNWEWDFNNDAVTDNTNENPTHTFPSTGTFSVYLFVQASTGCTADTTLPVTVNPLPQAQFTSDSVCANFPTSLSGQPAGGGTINLWDWDVNNNGTYEYSTQNANHTWTTGGTYDVKLHVTTTDGCVDSIVNQIIVHPEPVANFIADPECLNDATSFASTSTVASGVVSGYDWDFGDTNSSTQSPTTHTYGSFGQYSVSLTVSSNHGCTDMIQKTVEVYDLPIAQFTVDPVCEKDEIAVFDNSSITTTSNTDYNWDFGDSNSSTDEDPQHVYNNGSTYNVQLIATSVPDGCKDTATFNLDVYDKPLAQFTVVDECVYDSLSFTNISNSYSSTFSSFEWDFDDSNFSGDQHPVHQYSMEGTYDVQLIVTTVDGSCKDTAIYTANAYPKPQADFSPTDVCLNTATTFSDRSTVSTAEFPNAQILANQQWTFGDGGTGQGPSPPYTYTSPDQYLATIMVTTNHGCRDTVDKTVLVHPNPTANFAVSDHTGCSPVFAQFSDSSSIISNPGNYTLSHTWYFGNGDTSHAQHPSFNYDNISHVITDFYTVSLVVESQVGGLTCRDSTAKNNLVEVYPIPKARYSTDPPVTSFYKPNIIFTDQSIGANIWDWDFGDGSMDSSRHTEHIYLDTGRYTTVLYIENNHGCWDTTFKDVLINPEHAVYIPNAFSPNGDFKNDKFFARGIGILEVDMLIYDRWGNLIFQDSGLEPKWDGKYQGKEAKQDVYVYKIVVKNIFKKSKDYNGIVTLVR